MHAPRSTSIYALFILSCPKCHSEDLQRKADHVGCRTCGAWVFKVTSAVGQPLALVELDWQR